MAAQSRKESKVNRPPTRPTRSALLAVFLLLAACAAEAAAQNSSLFASSPERRPLTLANYSWNYHAPEVKKIELHDLITVIVSEQSSVISEGEIDRKKKAHADIVLKDWVLFDGLAMIPDPQSKGDPKISGKLDNKMKSEGSLDTRDSMKFRIACQVVDIRPNGNLIVLGRRSIHNNNEAWDYSLSGEVRPDDVLPNNTVLSENVAELQIDKRESGHVRDGYRRGWFLRWLDKWQPF